MNVFTSYKILQSHMIAITLLIIITLIHAEPTSSVTKRLRQSRDLGQHPFNFYVLSMSYQPEFCYSHNSHTKLNPYPGCESPLETWKHNLTIHGLWPQFTDGTWPSTCSNEKFNPSIMEQFGWNVLDEKWPNVKASESDLDEYVTFWEHEWTKHGTCSGLSQHEYFNAALSHFVSTPPVVYDYYLINSKQEHQASTDPAYSANEEIEGDIAFLKSFPKQLLLIGYGGPGNVVLTCSNKKYLSEIRMCFGKDEVTHLPLERITCPDSVMKEDSCGDDIVVSVFHEDAVEEINIAENKAKQYPIMYS